MAGRDHNSFGKRVSANSSVSFTWFNLGLFGRCQVSDRVLAARDETLSAEEKIIAIGANDATDFDLHILRAKRKIEGKEEMYEGGFRGADEFTKPFEKVAARTRCYIGEKVPANNTRRIEACEPTFGAVVTKNDSFLGHANHSNGKLIEFFVA